MKLDGKVAVVTGAGSGMGKAISLLYAQEGAQVIAVGRRRERLEKLIDEASAFIGRIDPVQGDISIEDDVDKIIEYAVKEYGRIDILVNNAGIMDDMMPVGEATDDMWNNVLAINLTGPFFTSRKAVNLMVEQESGGVIVNVASIAGLQGSRAGAAYTVSKHGLVGLTKNTAYMYAKKGIRCNAICPGAVETEIGLGMKAPNQLGMERAMSGFGTNPRSANADEIAKIALFLASDDSSFVNGAVLVADGGWTAY
jgi:NAD(P)-dependent dehydrogenase (short-subunit alcohol dehydrogenase family)